MSPVGSSQPQPRKGEFECMEVQVVAEGCPLQGTGHERSPVVFAVLITLSLVLFSGAKATAGCACLSAWIPPS